MSTSEWDVIVVGGSAAGLSAALMLGRARRRVLVIDGGEPRNRFAAHMQGVLGHDGTDPRQLASRGRAEAARYGVEFLDGLVERVEDHGRSLTVATVVGQLLWSRALIAATGIDDQLPDVPGLAERWGSSVLHCPYCHGWEVQDRRLGVLGTVPMGLHQAQLVRQWSDQVVFFSAAVGELDPSIEARLRRRGVEIVASPVVEVTGDGDCGLGVRTADGATVAVDALFTVGRPQPRDGFLAGLGLARNETPVGSFLAVDATGRTSHDRIWAVGNVADPAQNVPMAISSGATAGAVVNMALVTEDFDHAAAEPAAGARR
ncbi:MAG TPA: NAD(P)/FAD-dependent oxidoreductase [Acidimicrobiia bacterium]|nr:NAD(P)/FAD-dependent oxidoreductase [Acidimicrobiia bacterium]